MAARDVANAISGGDAEALRAALAEDVVLHGPVRPEVISGRDVVANTFMAVGGSLRDFALREFVEGGETCVARYSGFVGDGEELHVVQILRVDESGLVTEIVGSMRPMSTLQAWMDAMAQGAGKPEFTES